MYSQERVARVALALLLACACRAWPYPVELSDSTGKRIIIGERPRRVVSLAPSVTDMLFAIGADDTLVGVTYHTTLPAGITSKAVVGGFFSPSVPHIKRLDPDVVCVMSSHGRVRSECASARCKIIQFDDRSIAGLYRTLATLGRVFGRETEAQQTILKNRRELDVLSRKIARIPQAKRKRVIRLMGGGGKVMTVGDDSFMNEQIRAAGGVPPKLGRRGHVVPMTKEEWIRFDPQVIYGTDHDRKAAEAYFGQPGWGDVDAVKNRRIHYFPAALTCRCSVHTGYFCQWLAARIYRGEFAKAENWVLPEEALESRAIDVRLSYVASARVVHHVLFDFVGKTLVVELKEPMAAVSTLDGQSAGLRCVGNHYFQPACWDIAYAMGLPQLKKRICANVGVSVDTSILLYTGASMDNLSVKRTEFRDMVVYALVTAGITSNAQRTGVDEGRYYEPGTVNTIVLTNMRLTPRAMTRAIVTATEAKTAALQDLDVRSSHRPAYQATGTGTDNVLVVEGRGTRIDNAGGHTKMGELIAKAVYAGVREAVHLQNGVCAGRTIFRRLKERRIDVWALAQRVPGKRRLAEVVAELELLLLDPRYVGFVESALALSDAHRRNQVCDLSLHFSQCRAVAESIAGRAVKEMPDLAPKDETPEPLRQALNALLVGLHHRAE